MGSFGSLILYLLLACFLLASVNSQETGESQSATAESNASEGAARKPKVEEEEPAFLAAEPDQWGTYYDPQQEFCGKFDCYRILGFDYETFGSPDTKEITKRYRRLSRKWHPDKSKHPKAKERFVVR